MEKLGYDWEELRCGCSRYFFGHSKCTGSVLMGLKG